MTSHDLSKAKSPEMRASLIAFRRAAALARKAAIQTNTAIVVVRDGEIIRIPAAQLRAGEA